MSKRKWYTRAIYLAVALAMTLGLLMVPAVGAVGETEVCGFFDVWGDTATAQWDSANTRIGDYTPKFNGAAGEYVFAYFVPDGGTTASDLAGITSSPEWSYYYQVTGTGGQGPELELRFTHPTLYDPVTDYGFVDITVFAGASDFTVAASWNKKAVLATSGGGGAAGCVIYYGNEVDGTGFSGGVPATTLADVLALINTSITPDTADDWVLTRVGLQLCVAGTAYADEVTIKGATYDLEPCYTILPDIAKDVKGSEQRFEVWDWAWNATADEDALSFNWTVTPKLGLTADEVTTREGGTSSDNYIVIRSLEPGDASVECVVSGAEAVPAEKKWGLIHHTILDLDTDITGAQTDVSDEAGTAENATTENVTDTVYAQFYQEPFPATFIDEAGHAVVHWWLIVDDAAGENETAIDAIMAALGECPEEGTEPCGCGTYADWPVDETATDWQAEDNPFDAIETVYAASAAANTTFSAVIEGIVAADNDTNLDGSFNVVNDTYIKTMTEDDVGAQTRGLTGVTLSNIGAEDILIVTLVEYPWNYFGENPVCIEKGTKTWYPPGVPPVPEQIKAPQVRWAGEKIVLEKDWGTAYVGDVVEFTLQEGSVGSLEPTYDNDIADAQAVGTHVQDDGIARCILQSQPQGQADVKATLYVDVKSFPPAMGPLGEMTLQNHDFLVYFLALEDVTVDTDLSELEEIDAGDSANVTVKVRGWFTRDDLQSDRPREDVDGDGLYELPAGRIVLPDDWAALAGSDLATSNKASRPQYDLMNTPGAGVTNTTGGKLGPYDSGVRTTTIPGEAEAPCIGPFNALQPWSNFDAVTLDPTNMWITTASVRADSTVSGVLRCTVVPDATIDWYDCPMPQALVTFNVTDTGVLVLAALDKGTVLDYGIDADGNFTAPFYAVEIPSHWLIPVAGYFWDSWGVEAAAEGPYDYWDDVDVTPNDDDILEVYSDNHGYAGVTIVGTDLANECVTLDVIVDFPVMAAKYVAVDTWTNVCWGIPIEHLNADFEVSDRTGEATPDVPLTISFYGLKGAGTGLPWTTGGTEPYVKAEWDFDGDGGIDVTVENTTSTLTLVTQTFNFTAAGNYSPWLRVTDTNGLVDICEKPNYIVLTGEEPPAFPLCDIDDSGSVNLADFYLFALAFGSTPADDNWNANCDLVESGEVDIADFFVFAVCYDEHSE